MNKINFLCEACYQLGFFLELILFEQVKFKGPETPCKGELLKQRAGILSICTESPFIADDHRFGRNQQQRNLHCQHCTANHGFESVDQLTI